jgi:hypothetical protein
MGEQLTLPLPSPPARPRCPVRACPVRYRAGPDRLCPIHQHDAGDHPVVIPAWLRDAPHGVTGQARNALAPDPPGAA